MISLTTVGSRQLRSCLHSLCHSTDSRHLGTQVLCSRTASRALTRSREMKPVHRCSNSSAETNHRSKGGSAL